MKKFIFLVLVFISVNPLISQNPFLLNGISIWESNGKLYNVNPLDTVLIDINHITLIYQNNLDSRIIEEIENDNSLDKYFISGSGSITYKISVNNAQYISLISTLISNQNISEVHFEYILKYSDSTPNDELFGDLNFDHINVEYAWDIITGNSEIIVGVIDNGCNWEHPELGEIEDYYGNIFINHNDPWDDPDDPESGDDLDNDNNGYFDDYKGYDFKSGDNDVRPDEGNEEFHGTAMAGLIAAKTNNIELVAGIAGGWYSDVSGVKVLPVRNGDKDGVLTAVTPFAIQYAVLMGAKILNFSWGDYDWEDEQIDYEIYAADEQGILMFAATGNYNPNGRQVDWPASHEKVIAVGAADVSGNCKLTNANFGINTEITGVGVTRFLKPYGNITTPNSSTSGACATASGAAALILSYNPCLTNTEVREILVSTAREADGEFCSDGPYNYNWDPINKPGHSKKLGYGIIDLEEAFDYLTTNDPVTNEPLEITQYVPWDELKKVNADVTIYSGGILNITSEVLMYKDKRIIVLPGGQLIVDGGIITNACNGLWKGIEVWGDQDEHQFVCQEEIHQGTVIIKNGGTIENAEIGVLLGARNPESDDEFDESKAGGIIQVPYGNDPQEYDANFINNTWAVRFLNYQNHYYNPVNCSNTRPCGNRSYFYNCYFGIDTEYEGGSWTNSLVHMNKVDGIDFHFCTFENNLTAYPTGHGINAYGSGFSVKEICDSQMSPCPENSQNRSSFINFYKAANSLSSGIYTTTVVNTDFIDNSIGVYLDNVDFATIILSDFDVDQNVTGMNGCSYGIYMNECFGFAIEDNDFEKATSAPPGSYFGIYVSNTEAQDEIYRNTFLDFNYANLAIGKNWQLNYYWLGLQYICNQNAYNYKDFLVLQDNNFVGGIQSKQGSLEEAAGNGFSPSGQGDFMNYGNFDIEYYYLDYTHQVPEIISHVTPIEVEIGNTCPSHYGGGSGGEGKSLVLTSSQFQDTEQEYIDGLSDYNNVITLYENLVDGGNTEVTLTDVETAIPGDMWELRAGLLGKSPHLSLEVLKAAADKTEVLPESVIFEIMAANPDELKKEELIKYLEEKEEPLPTYMIDILSQLTGNVTYKTILQQQLAKHGWKKSRAAYDIVRSQLNDTITEFIELRNWLDNLASQRADEQIIESYIAEGNYIDASALANIVPSLYELEGDELAEYNHYLDMLDLTLNLSQEGRSILELDSMEFATVEFIAEASNGLAGIQAKNILEFAYDQNYCNCPEINDTTGLKTRAVNMDSFRKMTGITLTVEPNPARQWTAFNYSLPETNSTGEIKISDVSGKTIETISIKGEQGQYIWDTRRIKSGVYFYTFTYNGITESGKIIINN